MAQTFSLIHEKSMKERRGELKQAFGAWKNMIAEKYLQILLLQIGVPKFETRGWLSKTDKYHREICDVLLKQEHWDEIVELTIGMEWWPIGHKFPARGHVYNTEYRWSCWGECQRLRVYGLRGAYDSALKQQWMAKGDYWVLHENERSEQLTYRLNLFSVDGRLKKIIQHRGEVRLCFNNELEGVHYSLSQNFGTLIVAEWTNSNSKLFYEGRRPDR